MYRNFLKHKHVGESYNEETTRTVGLVQLLLILFLGTSLGTILNFIQGEVLQSIVMGILTILLVLGWILVLRKGLIIAIGHLAVLSLLVIGITNLLSFSENIIGPVAVFFLIPVVALGIVDRRGQGYWSYSSSILLFTFLGLNQLEIITLPIGLADSARVMILLSMETLFLAYWSRLQELQKKEVIVALDRGQVLARELSKFKLAVDGTTEMVVIADNKGKVVYANKAMKKMTGYSPKEALGKKAGVLWGGLMEKEFYEKMWKIIAEDKKVFIGEVINKKKNGTEYDAFISISPIVGENGEVEYYVALERDISKEKSLDRAKTELVSLASHQLRTPLSAISWYTEMLLAGDAGKLNKEQKQFLSEIYKSNQRMVELISALLNISRIELGTFAVEPRPTKIAEIVEDVLKELNLEIRKRDISIKKSINNKTPVVNLDPNLMRIVIQNLVTNSIKYTPANGEIAVKVDFDTQNLLIDVVDTGYGIPSNQKQKIFQKFFRADNVKEKDTSGTGLGLYIVKSIVDLSHGKISFTSEEDQGTTFSVKMPLSGMVKNVGSKPLETT